MPTYEYACTSCAHEWEFEQSIKDAPLTECPACHAATARRQISRGTGFILKGSGWYADLYSSSKPPAKSDSATEAKPAEAKSEGSSGGSKDGGTSSGTSGTPSGSGSPAPSGGTSGSSATSAAA